MGRKNIKREYVGECNINGTFLIVQTHIKWYDPHGISIHALKLCVKREMNPIKYFLALIKQNIFLLYYYIE